MNTGADPGFDVEGTKFGKGSGDCLRSPVGSGQSPGGGGGQGSEAPRKLLVYGIKTCIFYA